MKKIKYDYKILSDEIEMSVQIQKKLYIMSSRLKVNKGNIIAQALQDYLHFYFLDWTPSKVDYEYSKIEQSK